MNIKWRIKLYLKIKCVFENLEEKTSQSLLKLFKNISILKNILLNYKF